MMIALYIIIGIAIGAIALYLYMDRKMDVLRVEGGKKDIELSMRSELLNAANSRVQHLDAENKSLNAKTESQGRELELVRQQMSTELQRRDEEFKNQLQTSKEQFQEQLRTAREQFSNMAQQIMEASATKLKESNTEAMTGITKPLKDDVEKMQKAIHENLEKSAGYSACFAEQIRLMMEQTQQLGQKT